MRILNIEISKDQKYVFANLSTSEISVFSTMKFQVMFTITGYIQEKCLMRMAVGGPG